MSHECTYHASPNLALAKYWGKADSKKNLPATPSLGITLAGLETVTTARIVDGSDSVTVDGKLADADRFDGMFRQLRSLAEKQFSFQVTSTNSFPTAAGLASSSSGIAALAYSCGDAADLNLSTTELSELARLGSASAARSVFGGFVCLEAGAKSAYQLHPPEYWPELRVLLVSVDAREKSISSRQAMKISKATSPFYKAWVESSQHIFSDVVSAIGSRDLEKLGAATRQSYLRMFGTMFSSSPPIIYWRPDSLKVIQECANLRSEGFQAWETMDAGPQVKIVCLEGESRIISDRISGLNSEWGITLAKPGNGPTQIEDADV